MKRLVAPSNLALSVLWLSPALSFKHVSPASSFEKKARGFRRRRRRRERSRMGSHANHANHANLDLRAAPGWSGHPRLYRELLDQAVGKLSRGGLSVYVIDARCSNTVRWMDGEVILGFLGKSVHVTGRFKSRRVLRRVTDSAVDVELNCFAILAILRTK